MKPSPSALTLQELDEAIAASLADEAAGRVIDADEVFDQLEAMLLQRLTANPT